jgi:hypothetical protein
MGKLRPKRFTPRELEKVGIRILDKEEIKLECAKCGQVWFPMLLPGGGRLPRNYWKCPNGCLGKK